MKHKTVNKQIRSFMSYGYVGSSNNLIIIEESNDIYNDGIKLISEFGETMFEGKVEDAAQYILDLKNGKYAWSSR